MDVSSCANGSITINATCGNGNFSYAFLPNITTVQDSNFAATIVFTVTNDNAVDYDVYARDNNGTSLSVNF